MSRLKGGRSVQLRIIGWKGRTVATLPLYGLILKWGVSVVFIANALRYTPRDVIPHAYRTLTEP